MESCQSIKRLKDKKKKNLSLMSNGVYGGKGEHEQYIEGLAVVSLVMCSKLIGWKRRLICGRCGGRKAAP
jgi:hypothetical protein